jgi:hypothetical protein
VYEDPNGPLHSASNNKNYSQCVAEDPSKVGCNKKDHQNADVAKVNGYTEPSWVNGGSKPNIFPRITFPLLGLRFKPVKQLEARFTTGFSITEGFIFGLSGNYGLERPEKKTSGGATLVPRNSATQM